MWKETQHKVVHKVVHGEGGEEEVLQQLLVPQLLLLSLPPAVRSLQK
jgi:hypothetical protein